MSKVRENVSDRAKVTRWLLLLGCLACALMLVLFCGCQSSNSQRSSSDSADTSTESSADSTSSGSTSSDSATSSDQKASETVPANLRGAADDQTLAEVEAAAAADEIYKATINVQDYGTIEVNLFPEVAPITVANFITLARDGFYDGLTFHRIIDGFMIQGGDPNGNGTGGSGKNIYGEFSNNGYENVLTHERGVISMARSQAPNSASSQFFIMSADTPMLDGQYAAFGEVTEGMDVVDAITSGATPIDGNGTIPADQQPIIRLITITGPMPA